MSRTLLNRATRERAVATAATFDIHPLGGFAAAAFDPGFHHLRLSPLPLEMSRHLRTVEHRRDHVSGEITRHTVALVLPAQGGGVHVPVGLLPLVHQAGRLGGRPGAGPRAGTRSISPTATTGTDPLLPQTLSGSGRVVCRYARGVDPAALVAALASAFPGERVAVVCSNRRAVGHLTAELRRLGVDARTFHAAVHADGPPPRVVVGTAAGLTSEAASHEGCRIVVVTDPVHFVGPAGVGPRLEPAWATARWVGLVSDDRPLSPHERDRLTAFFGPAELSIPRHGWVRRRVLFAEQRVTATGPVDATTPQTRVRTGVVRNGPRNRLLVALAGELTGRHDRSPSGRFGVVAAAAGVPGGVTVLAVDAEHRTRLLGLRRADQRAVCVVTPAELTDPAAEAARPTGVLVRADAGIGLPPLPGSMTIEPQTARSPLLVVDVPVPHPAVAAAALNREREYRTAGWVPLAAERGGYADWDRWMWRRRNLTV